MEHTLENKIAMKRKIASIVENMLVLIDNPCEGSPFIDRILPGLQKANETMTDDEAKNVIQKACKSLDSIQNQLLEYKSLTAEVVLKIIQKECCFENISTPDFFEALVLLSYSARVVFHFLRSFSVKKERRNLYRTELSESLAG